MRIVSGNLKGRTFNPPKGLPVRPTTDFAKEALFNVLNNRIDFEQQRVLDLFAGTGNITLEFASRGCERITSVDADARCCKFIKETCAKFNLNQVTVFKSDVFEFIKRNHDKSDLVFCDPPYDFKFLAQLPDAIFGASILNQDALVIVEHGEYTSFESHIRFVEHRKYGNVHFSFFK
jgi:16S rRNA (guanine966-N2)-methyltransferase